MPLNQPRLERIRERTNALSTQLSAIHDYYYSSHPTTGQYGLAAKLKAELRVASVFDYDWAKINEIMNEYIAFAHHDGLLLIAAKAIAHLRLKQRLILPNGQSAFSAVFARALDAIPKSLIPRSWITTENTTQADGMIEIEEKLKVVKGWLNIVKSQLMPGFLERAGAVIGGKDGKIFSSFHSNN